MSTPDWMVMAASNILLAAVLGGAAWAVARWTRRPAVAHALYLLALIKLITPSVFGVPILTQVSGGSFATPGAAMPAASPTAMLSHGVAHGATAVPAETVLGALTWPAWVAIAWLIGSLVAWCLVGWRTRRFGRCIAAMQQASEVVQHDIERLAARLGLRRAPRALVVDAAISPMVCMTRGGLRLILPSRLLATLSTVEREAMLAHELAHIRRRDHLVRLLELLVVGVWWWLPLVYLLRRGLHRVEELCCDAVVVTELPGEQDSYSNVLLAAAGLLDRGAHPVPIHACGLGPVAQLEQRIQMMLTQKMRPDTGPRGLLLVAVAALAVLPFAACGAPTASTARLNEALQGEVLPQEAVLAGAIAGPARIDVVRDKTTLLEAVTRAKPTSAADLTRVVLIRPDATDPMTLQVDVREMIMTGNTRHNVLLQAGDVLYIPTGGETTPLPPVMIDKPKIEKGDRVVCLVAPAVIAMPGAERLALLTQWQQIGEAGTILVPHLGSVQVVGLTTKAASVLLNEKLRQFYSVDLQIQVRASRVGTRK